MAKKKDSEHLEQTAERIRTRFKDSRKIFPVYRFPEDRIVDWDGNDIEDFLAMCEKSPGSLVYICELRPQQINAEYDEFFMDRIGQLSQLEIAFLQDGYFHRFKEVTDWWKEYRDSHEEGFDEIGEASIPKKEIAKVRDCITKLAEEEVTDEFIKGFMASGNRDSLFDVRLFRYISEKYDLPNPELGRDVLDIAGQEVREAFDRFSDAVEEAVVESLVPALMEWVSRNKRSKIQKVDTQVFLSERHVRISKDAVNVLWCKVKYLVDQGESLVTQA